MLRHPNLNALFRYFEGLFFASIIYDVKLVTDMAIFRKPQFSVSALLESRSIWLEFLPPFLAVRITALAFFRASSAAKRQGSR